MKARLGKSYSHANSRSEAWKSIGRFTSWGRAETEMERSLVRERLRKWRDFCVLEMQAGQSLDAAETWR
jgi:hypothetical protein